MRALNILRHVALIAVVASGADAQTVAITGGTVYPVSGPRIENGTVLIRDGKIVAVGANVTIPADARRIDASGKWVTPGFIHAATNLGLGEAGSPQFSGGYNDGAATGAAGIAASFEAWKGINPANTFLIPQRLEGVTTIGIASGRGMVAGKVGVIDLIDANTAPEMLRKAPVAMLGDFGNPGSGNTGARAEYWAKWRTLFDDVKAYQSRRAAFEQGNTREFAAPRTELEALIPVVSGQLPLWVTADRATDIVAALAFAKEYNVRLWINGGAEAWIVASELAAARVPVFTGAMNNIPGDFNSLGMRQENAAMLRAAGVTVVLTNNGPADGGGYNARNIRQEAGNAVAYGMGWDEALRSTTLTPAEVLGIADQVGSLAVGRDANVVVWSGDPFEFLSVAEHVFVRGRTFTTKSRQQQLTERYMTLPPAYRRP
jgi:imidazolonepropionase-like amidohydrolase